MKTSSPDERFMVGTIVYDPVAHAVLVQHINVENRLGHAWYRAFMADSGHNRKIPSDGVVRYNVFGGPNRHGETPLGCLVRHLRRELGIDIDPANIAPPVLAHDTELGTPLHMFVTFVRVKDVSTPRSHGSSQFDWMPLAEAHKLVFTGPGKPTAAEFDRYLQDWHAELRPGRIPEAA
jgi:hypothetical protein